VLNLNQVWLLVSGDKLLLNGAYRDNDHTDVLDADYIHQTRSKQEEVSYF